MTGNGAPPTGGIPLGTEGLFERGDRVPPFCLPDTRGVPVTPQSDEIAGRPTILAFDCTGIGEPAEFEAELAGLRDIFDALEAEQTAVFAITRRDAETNRRLKETLALPYPVLSDTVGAVYRACGLDPDAVSCPAVTYILDANLRAVEIVAGGEPGFLAERSRTVVKALAAESRGMHLAGHPPVIVLPRALTPKDCARIIDIWHRPVRTWHSDGQTSQGHDAEAGDFKVRNESYGRVVQMVLREPAAQKYLDAKLGRRVLPEIERAFQTKVTRREDYRIAGYDSTESGSLPPHRDNPTPGTQHRRFTVSVNLNAEDYTGGGLRFPEYGTHEYHVATGTAVVWSCTLLHEVLPVLSGRRFILGTHMFGGTQ